MSTATLPECGDLFEKAAATESDMRGNSINTREQKPVHYRWLIHFADSEPMEVAYSPPATHGEALAAFPEALAAEPWPEEGKGTPATICKAGNAKPGLALGDGLEI